MHDFHGNKKVYFEFQYKTSKNFIIPFLESLLPTKETLRVLEIGCAEAGVLKAFTAQKHQCLGIELSPLRVDTARRFMASEIEQGLINSSIGSQFS